MDPIHLNIVLMILSQTFVILLPQNFQVLISTFSSVIWQTKYVCMLTLLAYLDSHLTDEMLLTSTWKCWGKELELFMIVLNPQSWLTTKLMNIFRHKLCLCVLTIKLICVILIKCIVYSVWQEMSTFYTTSVTCIYSK